MSPSAPLPAVALAASLVLAGCVGVVPPGESPSTDGPTTNVYTPSPIDAALSECRVPEPVSPTPTTEPGTRSGTGDLRAGLEVQSAYDGNLTVVLRRLPQNVTTFARRYPADAGPVDLGPKMGDKSGYWTVVVAGCEVVWSRRVSAAEAYEIRVGPDGNVSVLSYVVA